MSRTPADARLRTAGVRLLALLAVFVSAVETIIVFAGDAPAQHRWLAVVFALAVCYAAYGWRMDSLRRVAWLGLLSGAMVVSRATIRFDNDLASPLVELDIAAVVAVAGIAALGLIVLSRAIGIGTALLAGLAGVSILGCLGLVLERSPGARLGVSAVTVNKGAWPHRTFGQWYPPGSRVRAFFKADPRRYYDPPAPLARQWRLNVHTSRDAAELRFDPATPTTLRAEILHSEPGEPWAIQLNQGPIVVHAGRRYELRFRARADRARDISVAISEWHPPWQGLGFSRMVHIGTEWMDWSESFTLLRDDTNARVHFDVGNNPASVELADIQLTDLATAEGVSSDPMPYSLTHDFNDVGCRGDGTLERSPDNTYRILVLGDAYALGPGVRDEDLVAARLARALAEQPPSSGAQGHRVVAMTCAVPGWGARQERQFYESLRHRYDPDLVLVVVTWNDGRLASSEASFPGDGDARNADASRIAPELLRLAGQARSDGARFAVVVFRNTPAPIWKVTLDALTPIRDAGIPVLDLWPALTATHPWETLADASPALLPNEIAHGLAADAIVEFLRSHGLAR